MLVLVLVDIVKIKSLLLVVTCLDVVKVITGSPEQFVIPYVAGEVGLEIDIHAAETILGSVDVVILVVLVITERNLLMVIV